MNKYSLILFCALSVSLLACSKSDNTATSSQSEAASTTNKQELIQAVKALQKLDSSVHVGTNMLNYTSQITDAKPDVDTYLLKDSSSATSKKVSRVLNLHLVALNWWKCDVAQPASSLDEYTVYAKCRDAVLPTIFELSPTIKEQAEAAIAKKQTTYKSDALDKSAVLQLIWQETGTDTKELLKETIS